MHASISAIDFRLPTRIVTTAELRAQFPECPVDKTDLRTGIEERHIAADGECASDLAVMAVQQLFTSGKCNPEQVDFLLFCTQTPDYLLPTTACLLQDRLGLSRQIGALDFNLGCSGFIYGLGLAEGLISSGQATSVLLVTAETYSKFMSPTDRSVRSIFGDGAAATLLNAKEAIRPFIGPFVYGTDGSGGSDLIVPTSGMRIARTSETAQQFTDSSGNQRSSDNLYMNGSRILDFMVRVVPAAVTTLLDKAGITDDDVDLYVFHQANAYALEYLRRTMGISRDKFHVALRHFGNTVSSTIPIALQEAIREGRVRSGALIVVVGFGVGYSWGATIIRWV